MKKVQSSKLKVKNYPAKFSLHSNHGAGSLKLKVFFLSFLCFFWFLPSPILAAPTLELTSYPSSIQAFESFDISVKINGLESGAKYFIKAIGGSDWYQVRTWSEKKNSWVAWNEEWKNMPEFTGSEGEVAVNLKAKFNLEAPTGTSPLKTRIRKDGSDNNYDSGEVQINVLPAVNNTATPTPTQETNSSATLTPTPTAAPTATPTLKTTSALTITPTTKPTPKPTPTPTEKAEEKILGEGTEGETTFVLSSLDEKPTPEEEKASEKKGGIKQNLPKIMIGIGGLLILVALFSFLAPLLKLKLKKPRGNDIIGPRNEL